MTYLFRKIFKFIFWIKGWKVHPNRPDVKKAVIIVLGHTSNWDFINGSVVGDFFKMDIKFTIKQSWVKFPLKNAMLNMGAFPIKRGLKENFVQQVVRKYNESESFYLSITPEATRKANAGWKTGFYHIAKGANVPLILGFIDYDKKVAGFGPCINVRDSYEETLKEMIEFYKTINPKYPENFLFPV